MTDCLRCKRLPEDGRHCSVQVPGGPLSLCKIIENRKIACGWWTLVQWIDIRRANEWVPTTEVPPL